MKPSTPLSLQYAVRAVVALRFRSRKAASPTSQLTERSQPASRLMSNPPKHQQQPRTCDACGRICCVPVTSQGEEYVAVGQRLDRHRGSGVDGETIILEGRQAALSDYAFMCRVTAEREGGKDCGSEVICMPVMGGGYIRKAFIHFPVRRLHALNTVLL